MLRVSLQVALGMSGIAKRVMHTEKPKKKILVLTHISGLVGLGGESDASHQ